MRVLVCPDKFAGTLSALQAAAAVVAGWRSVAPADELVVRPLSDGGPGFLDVIESSVRAWRIPVSACDPLGRPARADVLLVGDTAYVECAQTCGLHLLRPDERDPKATTSYGLGLVMIAAIESGAHTLVVGLGGSGTNDGGAGMLAALDAAPLDEAGYALPYGGAALLGCARLAGAPRLRSVRIVAATDVDNPLTGLNGASAVFGPQKGARPDDVSVLDAALARFAEVLEREIPGCPPDLAHLPGAGAAGGLGAGLMALGGRRESGFAHVRQVTGFDRELDTADLVITGEGSFDPQSLRGKVVSGVAAAARDRGIPCVVVAGQVSAGRREAAQAGVTEAHSLAEHAGGVTEAIRHADETMRSVAARLAGQWSRTR